MTGTMEKSSPIIRATTVIFNQLAKENNSPMGEIWPQQL
jgi:hypothetical protein